MLTKLETKRQIVHLLYGLIIILLLEFDIINYIHLFIWFFISLVLVYIAKANAKIPILSYLLEHLERESEKEGLRAKGFLFYTLGAALAVLIFEKNIAMASIMILAVGDSVSRIVGPYGYLKHPFNSKKFIEGVIIGGILAAASAMIFVKIVPAILASAISMFIESLDIEINNFKIDDNLTIPLIAGAVMYILGLF